MTVGSAVGFVGVGAMGSRMAKRILDAGHDLVVYNRTPERARALRRAGAKLVDSPAEVAESADVVVGCLLDSAAVRQVYDGPNGLVGASRSGQIFVEHGTFAPDVARELAARLAGRGAFFLDAPVSGGPDGVTDGSLAAMVGGAEIALAGVREVVELYCKTVRLVGPTGAGLQLKLVNQLIVSSHVATAAEAAAVLRALDIRLDTASEILNSGWAASTMLERTLTRLHLDGPVKSDVTLGGMLEPQALATELVAGAGLELSVYPAVTALFRAACADGRSADDFSALVGAVEAVATEIHA